MRHFVQGITLHEHTMLTFWIFISDNVEQIQIELCHFCHYKMQVKVISKAENIIIGQIGSECARIPIRTDASRFNLIATQFMLVVIKNEIPVSIWSIKLESNFLEEYSGVS